jgi:hypothetical protein
MDIPVEVHQVGDLMSMIVTLEDYRVNIWFTINKDGDLGHRINKELDFAERNFWDIQSWWCKYFSKIVEITMMEFLPWNIFLPRGENLVYIPSKTDLLQLEKTKIMIPINRIPFEICESDLTNTKESNESE